ncbi:DNA-binding protein [Cryobacterium sinapicolor]|uniref:DNA-binding protein n=1 Tax=Cryobacterium sinapicolor TaxID=1259236 RepID=A0ABY2IWN4_9MICO|nr:helix-turn-helix domain-containing protein [Cryobacterium sinapicolor]TFC96218.1 DNA-binding protein [Cryobacterium sinapicolor]
MTAICIAPQNEVFDLDWLRGLKRATVTRTEAAKLYGVDPRTITAAIEQGTVPAIKLGRRVVIPREPLLALLTADHTQAAN